MKSEVMNLQEPAFCETVGRRTNTGILIITLCHFECNPLRFTWKAKAYVLSCDSGSRGRRKMIAFCFFWFVFFFSITQVLQSSTQEKPRG